MLSREIIERVIKETDNRISIPIIKDQIIGCPGCGKMDTTWFARSATGLVGYTKHFQKEHLKPQVFVLYHTDPYDSIMCDCGNEIGVDQKDMIGIFSTRALAEQMKKKIKSKIPYKEEDFSIKKITMDNEI